MPKHKFVYTVSGVDLSDEQKTTISQAIGVAVANVLIGQSPPVSSDFLSYCVIRGGIWIDPNLLAADETVGTLMSNAVRDTQT